jgi:predicted dehydrogenase
VANKVKVGLLGCGNIAPAYIKGSRHFSILEVAACTDLVPERAQALAGQYGLRACSVDELLTDPDIGIIINLTVPKVHAEVSLMVIQAGKHVYSEKPLGITREEGQRVMAAARDAGVRVGCAPDTFLGGGGQTCRKLIDEGAIGQPVAAVAFMASHGPESWHPNPFFYYQVGGGPLLDMGPYYLTALVNLLGPVRRVSGSARMSFTERTATSEHWPGAKIPVEVPTHVAGVLDFESGAIATLMISFDVWSHHLPRIEVYGSQGSLSVPDPNTFKGPVSVWQSANGAQWAECTLTHSDVIGRGTGVADMAYAIQSGRPHRASGDLALHVLDIMQAIGEASESGQSILLSSHVQRPAALPTGLPEGELDA